MKYLTERGATLSLSEQPLSLFRFFHTNPGLFAEEEPTSVCFTASCKELRHLGVMIQETQHKMSQFYTGIHNNNFGFASQ